MKKLIFFQLRTHAETEFLTVTTIKNKLNNGLDISPTMELILTKSIEPRIDKIIPNQLEHISYKIKKIFTYLHTRIMYTFKEKKMYFKLTYYFFKC